MVQVTFDLDDDALALLRQTALREGLTEAEVVARAVQDHVDRAGVEQKAVEIGTELERQFHQGLEGLLRGAAEGHPDGFTG